MLPKRDRDVGRVLVANVEGDREIVVRLKRIVPG